MSGQNHGQPARSRLRTWFRGLRGHGASDPISFRCNICGEAQQAPPAAFSREEPSCDSCGSTVRMRSIVHALSLELFGRSTALPDFPDRPDLVGVGMSDWPGYADPLAAKVSYENTFLHQPPRLDILDPPAERLGTLDFLISTDVFEHVLPPVQPAFDNARRLLKPTGVFVFSVPYNLEGSTTEHFPDLHDFQVEEVAAGEYVLRNTTRSGESQEFRDLVFHGGPGSTLEMRVFSLPDLLQHLDRAGFRSPTIHGANHEECGMIHAHGWSLTMSVRPQA